jgi:hypothetical protein
MRRGDQRIVLEAVLDHIVHKATNRASRPTAGGDWKLSNPLDGNGERHDSDLCRDAGLRVT